MEGSSLPIENNYEQKEKQKETRIIINGQKVTEEQ